MLQDAIPVPKEMNMNIDKEHDDIWREYRFLEADDLLSDDLSVIPDKIIKRNKREIKEKTKGPCSILDFARIIIPVCVEYKVCQKTYWQHLQGWTRKTTTQ